MMYDLISIYLVELIYLFKLWPIQWEVCCTSFVGNYTLVIGHQHLGADGRQCSFVFDFFVEFTFTWQKVTITLLDY